MLTFENYGAQDQGTMHLLDLPVVMIEHIFSFLTYDEVAKNRIVCKDFDSICQRMLNRGFLLIERRHALSLKAIKTQLPRRESERRFHAFAKHNDILTSIETRLSMLSMTYAKFIDQNVCCFIPGKVIDEIDRLLGIVEHSPVLPRAHEVLQELRDISSMAIEHFDDKISSELRQRMLGGKPFNAPPPDGNVAASGGEGNRSCSADNISEFACFRIRCIKNHRSILQLSEKYSKILKRMKIYKRHISNQNRHIKELSRRQADQDGNMAELKKRIEECDVKYQELTHSQVSGGKGIKDIAASPVMNCVSGSASQSSSATLKNFSSQIKLDPSHLHMGPSRGRPNIRPRKASVDQPPNREHSLPTSKALGQHGTVRSTLAHSRPALNRLAARGSRPLSNKPGLKSMLGDVRNIRQLSVKRGNTAESFVFDGSVNNLVDSIDDSMNDSARNCPNGEDNIDLFVESGDGSCENAIAGPSSASKQVINKGDSIGQEKRRKIYESLYKAFAIIDGPSETETSSDGDKITAEQLLNLIARAHNVLPPQNVAEYVNIRDILPNLVPAGDRVRPIPGIKSATNVNAAICDEFVAVGNKLVALNQIDTTPRTSNEPVDVDFFQKRKRVYSEGCIGCRNLDEFRLVRQCTSCENSNAESSEIDIKRRKL